MKIYVSLRRGGTNFRNLYRSGVLLNKPFGCWKGIGILMPKKRTEKEKMQKLT